MNKKKSSLKRLLISLATISALLFILLGLFLYFSQKRHAQNVKLLIIEEQQNLLKTEAKFFINKDEKDNFINFSQDLKNSLKTSDNILQINIFKKTADENYFYLISQIKNNNRLTPELKKGTVIKEKSDMNLLRQGFLQENFNQTLYNNQKTYWYNYYLPIKIKKKNYVAQVKLNAENIVYLTSVYNQQQKKFNFQILISVIFFILLLLLIILLFKFRFKFLLENISSRIEESVEKKIKPINNIDAEKDFSELFISINSAINTIQNNTTVQAPIDLDNIFKLGVKFLKEKKYSEAITIFEFITQIKSESYGGFFNLAVCYAKTKNYQLSEKMFQKALELNENDSTCQKYLQKVKYLQEKSKN